MESDAPPPEYPNLQVIHEVDFETLSVPSKIALDSESRIKHHVTLDVPVSQNVSGPIPSLPPFDSELFQPSQVEG